MHWKDHLKVFGGVSFIIGLAVFNVLGPKAKTVKPGHDTFSNEKPEALRKEAPRNLEEERAKMALAQQQKRS